MTIRARPATPNPSPCPARSTGCTGRWPARRRLPPRRTARQPLAGDAPASRGTRSSACAALFGLSSFERDLLVLCAGHSLESRFVSGCAAALNDARALPGRRSAWP